MQLALDEPGVQVTVPEAWLGAPEGGVLPAASMEALLLGLLGATGQGRITLSRSLVSTWGPRLETLGRPWRALPISGASSLDTLMDAVAEARPGDQVWINLGRVPSMDALDLLALEAFMAFAGSRQSPPLVVLMRDDAPWLGRTQRLAVDRLGNVLLVRETTEGAYALGMPALLDQLADRLPRLPLPRVPALGGRRHLLVLDVDGVLIDPGRAFSEAVAGALAELAPGLAWDDQLFAAFKRVGGFNNDFRLTAAALALAEAGGLGDLEAAIGIGFPHLEARIQALEPLCRVAVQRHYLRSRRLERPLVKRQELAAFKENIAIFTGRPPAELALAFEVLAFRLPAVGDSAAHLRKPRPEGLLQLADGFRASHVTFVGDTCDDAAALRSARALRPGIHWTFAAVGADRARFALEGDLQAVDLRTLLPHLEDRSRL